MTPWCSEGEELRALNIEAARGLCAVFVALNRCRDVVACIKAHGHGGLHMIDIELDVIYITRRQDERV